MCEALVGDANGERIVLRVLAREFPDSCDEWDGNWLKAEIDVVAGGFRGHVECYLSTVDFVAFHKQVGDLRNGLAEEAAFSTLEEWLSLRIAKDEGGRLSLTGDLADAAGGGGGIGNLLRFGFRVEERRLTLLLEELAAIVERFPPRGVGG
jgi:hypothetical protein